MTTYWTPLRGALALLLVGSPILFFVGSTVERHNRHESALVAAAPVEGTGIGDEPGQSTEGSEAAASASTEGAPSHVESQHAEAGAKLLGIDTESLALSIVAVVLSLLLAGAILLGRSPELVLLAALAFGLAFAAGDGRELVHQLGESNNGLAATAAILIALHLAIAALAAAVLRRTRVRGMTIAETG